MTVQIPGELIHYLEGRGDGSLADGYYFENKSLFLYSKNYAEWYEFKNVRQAVKDGRYINAYTAEIEEIPEYFNESIKQA